MSYKAEPPTRREYDLTTEIKQQIKELCLSLLPMPEEYEERREVPGSELIAKGISEVKRGGIIVPVAFGNVYPVSTFLLRTCNHEAKLRRFYRQQGLYGIFSYLNVVGEIRMKMMLCYPSLFDEGGTFLGLKEEGMHIPRDPAFVAMQKQAAAENKASNN